MNKPIHKASPIFTRFAPSPTGLLHLGHAYAALFSAKVADHFGGSSLLRMEDIDGGRCRQTFEDAIFEDMAWLGLNWTPPVRRQSEHMQDYQAALDKLQDLGLLYPCFCTRKDIAHEINAAQGAPHLGAQGPDGPLYPGTCRHLRDSQRKDNIDQGRPFALRLDMNLATQYVGDLEWTDLAGGPVKATPEIFGDVVLARKDIPTSYHLAVTVDDDLQNIRIVTRGSDLFQATHIHRLLQKLLNLHTPDYFHHKLMKDPSGQRLAKRSRAMSLSFLREKGHTCTDIFNMINPLISAQFKKIT